MLAIAMCDGRNLIRGGSWGRWPVRRCALLHDVSLQEDFLLDPRRATDASRLKVGSGEVKAQEAWDFAGRTNWELGWIYWPAVDLVV